jgi:protoheme IX farnesyltransferase
VTIVPPSRSRLASLLAASAIGVYLLVAIGATTALTEAAAACAGWPVCALGGRLGDPLVWIALAHRAVAGLVGVLLLLAGVLAWRTDTPRRVRAALAMPMGLYPVQVAIGALAAVGEVGWVPGAHLAVGMTIFAGVVLALGWTLEANTPGTEPSSESEPRSTSGRTDPSGSTALGPAVPESAVTGVNAGPAANAVPTEAEATPAESGNERQAGRPAGLRRTLSAYASLTKPRLMWLLCLVAAAAMALAAGPALEARTVVLTLSGGVLAIGASGTFNHVLERDVDRRMNRTADRPLAVDEVSVTNALAFGFALALASLWVFLQVNLLAAFLGLLAIAFYSVIYTLVLKPNTVQNTVLGGAAGALPALIGWAAVTGSVDLPGALLAVVIFCWTPAHFYNLALAYKDDYERGGFPMLPVVRGEAVTRRHVLWYLGATLLAAVALAALTGLGWVYAAATVLLGGVFLGAVVKLHRERTTRAAFRAFHASNAYLGTVLLAIVIDALAM